MASGLDEGYEGLCIIMCNKKHDINCILLRKKCHNSIYTKVQNHAFRFPGSCVFSTKTIVNFLLVIMKPQEFYFSIEACAYFIINLKDSNRVKRNSPRKIESNCSWRHAYISTSFKKCAYQQGMKGYWT